MALTATVDAVIPTARISRNATERSRWIAPFGRSNAGVSHTSSSAVWRAFAAPSPAQTAVGAPKAIVVQLPPSAAWLSASWRPDHGDLTERAVEQVAGADPGRP